MRSQRELRRIEAEANKAVEKPEVFTHYPEEEELSQIEYQQDRDRGQVRIIEFRVPTAVLLCSSCPAYTGSRTDQAGSSAAL